MHDINLNLRARRAAYIALVSAATMWVPLNHASTEAGHANGRSVKPGVEHRSDSQSPDADAQPVRREG